MIELNAGTRLVADAKSDIAKAVQAGKYVIVEGQGHRWMAVKFPNGRYGIIDSQAPGENNAIRAAGLDEGVAIKAVKEANSTGKYHPAMSMRG